MRLSRDAIVARLEAHGLRHRSVACATEGEYLPTDVDWNNKDIVHRNVVHSRIDDVPCVTDRDLQAAISLQKIAGARMPLVLVHYDDGHHRQTHFLTILWWTMVTEHEFIPLSPTRTRAVTTYTVAGNRFWMLFFPLIRALLRRNHRQLMSEDVPMRTRRGELRAWGYTFKGDGPPRDIRSTISIAANNVLPPDQADTTPPTFPAVSLSSLVDGQWTFVGRNDHLGLKLLRRGDRVHAFPRMCPHEGADLDDAALEDGCLSCPWHGRKLPPVAIIELGIPRQEVRTDWHGLKVDDDALQISVVQKASTNPEMIGPESMISPDGTGE